jgi:MFS family permease
MTATGIGALAGSLLVANLGRVRRRGMLLLAGIATSGVSLMLFTVQRELAAALPLALLVGLTTIVFNGMTNTILQTNSPDHLRGRVMSAFTMIFMGIMPLGQLVLGALGSLFGVEQVLFVGGAVALGSALYAYVRVGAISALTSARTPHPHPHPRAAPRVESLAE